MTPQFILLHSPLAPPGTWQPVAAELARWKRTALTPYLPLDGAPFQFAFAAQVAAHAEGYPGPFVLAAHSAAGAFVPAIGAALGNRVAACLFVDARLPAANTNLLDSSPPEFAAKLRSLNTGGRLPPWAQWFSPEQLSALLPEAKTRTAFIAGCPSVPLALLEEILPEVAGWPDVPCAYLQFSPAYDAEAEEARRRGWLVSRLPGGHLHMLAEPRAVARSLLTLTEHLLEGKTNYTVA